ncbi:lysophospholipase [Mycolicibacterium celeriflavum]|uniref:Lysophospholipase n=1 Tax=Mycolicibacterium celeriflavum TaxID=1249101 RepID=A0A1X0BTA7_MYCCF|nr:SGNH/GDSL hydrolase family protein [Mycolicibacterium celeriflavum]MCV7238833.1 SGNH/GDSL hydrolase family protein [Mycolicibacterium celeriflavum]OBG24460.1 lysophospholipase [Mycolicibacterium celeriflavum]ORA46190.1 lysophospholipase [Mycolicibacterium celeriflavum]BBY42568.1 lysophospholipase [Mycolicibacterium celeriflavum]
MVRYSRYVAVGDSQTEGLWDGDESGGLVGFADRLAASLDSHYPGLAYANLAVRGRRIRDVLDEQLPQAMAMQPDLITVCIGMNDVTRPGLRFRQALAELDELHDRLAASDATVVTTTFPDLARILPIGRVIAGRVERINDVIRTAAERYGFRLVDLYHAPSMTDLDTWSADRVHGSTKGHILFAAAAAEALGLPGSNHDWVRSSDRPRRPSLRSQAYSQLLWTRNMLMPWLWSHLRGRSSGEGRGPRRPRLEVLAA